VRILPDALHARFAWIMHREVQVSMVEGTLAAGLLCLFAFKVHCLHVLALPRDASRLQNEDVARSAWLMMLYHC
jgi:hypothetical protein